MKIRITLFLFLISYTQQPYLENIYHSLRYSHCPKWRKRLIHLIMKSLIVLTMSVFCASPLIAQDQDLLKYVNTMQGTNNTFEFSHGRTSVSAYIGFKKWSNEDIINGKKLKFEMGPNPQLKRGTALEDRPFSVSK